MASLCLQVTYRSDAEMDSRFNPCYCLTKAMLNRAVQLLAEDPLLADRGISINAVDPGWCRCALVTVSEA